VAGGCLGLSRVYVVCLELYVASEGHISVTRISRDILNEYLI
jgi:hypothetical protein